MRCHSDDDDAAEVAQLLVVEAQPVQLEPPVADPVADRLLDRVGLLVDLLEHERLEAALLGRLDVPVDLVDFGRPLAVDRPERGPIRRDGDDLVVLDELDAFVSPRNAAAVEARNISSSADAYEQRALVARPDEQLRVLAVEDDEREVPLQLGVGGAHRGDEVALVVALDEVRDDLGVRLGRELVAFPQQRRLQLAVVLDDPVEHEVDVALQAPVRGWAFSAQTRPCVAQRVCPTPVVAMDLLFAAASFSPWRLPTTRIRRASRSRRARGPPSHSRDTRAVRGPQAGSAVRSGFPT